MSNINYLSINENFPVAGQDNDTQVFRDNFDTIKTSLRLAKEELEVFQDVTTGAARLNVDNDFGLHKLQNAVLENVREAKWETRGDDPITVSPNTVDFQNGTYQIYKVGASVALDFLNFPGDSRMVPAEDTPIGWGKVRLELYSDGLGDWTVTFSLSGSGATSIKSLGFPTPGSVTLSATTNLNDPVIIEVWRHRENEFFMHYLGTFA